MILSDIRDYVKDQKQASLKDISIHFDIPESAAEEMVEHWIRKGKIKRLHPDGAACSCACGHKCSDCPAQCAFTYQWVES